MKHFKYALYLVVAGHFCMAFAGDREDFYHAISIDAGQIVTKLLQNGFDPNTLDGDGQHGLFLALRVESLNVVAALLANPKTQTDAANTVGETPLMMAALRGNLEMTKTLLARGGLVQREGWTPLHYAAAGPSVDVVALLLDRGAAIDARSPNGTTPLMMAARYGAIDAADLLLRRGADPNLRNQRDLTAADFAQGAGRESLARRLQPK